MQYTTNYNLNKPEGTDIVNPLTVDNPNWESIDAAMYANKQTGVQTAQVALQETTIAITRDKSKPATFRFIATMNYATNMTITVDGTSVTATMPDGSALAANAFRIGSNVLCSLNGTSLTIYTNPAIDTNAIKTAILQAVFPVGSIYTNINDSTNPATTFGFGTWERIQGQFILGASATAGAGSTGGNSTVTLKAENIPALEGTITNGTGVVWAQNNANAYMQTTQAYAVAASTSPIGTPSSTNQIGMYDKGKVLVNGEGSVGKAFDNMPPYLAAYMWKRTA